MSDSAMGRIISVDEDGDIEISLPGQAVPDVGARFNVLNENGGVVAEIKVIEANPSKIVARNFLSSNSARTGAGAAAGAAIGTVLFPAVGTIIGGVAGALAGSMLQKQVHAGMRVVPITKIATVDPSRDDRSS